MASIEQILVDNPGAWIEVRANDQANAPFLGLGSTRCDAFVGLFFNGDEESPELIADGKTVQEAYENIINAITENVVPFMITAETTGDRL